MQIVLLVTHISLLLTAKRAIICQDLGDHKDIRDEKVTRPLETDPLNNCCRKIHKTFCSEHNRVRTATNLLTSRSFFLLCAVLSLWQPFLQSLLLFDVVLILPRLGAFTEALMSAIPKVGDKFNISLTCCELALMFVLHPYTRWRSALCYSSSSSSSSPNCSSFISGPTSLRAAVTHCAPAFSLRGNWPSRRAIPARSTSTTLHGYVN